jgi:hypothetical protein
MEKKQWLRNNILLLLCLWTGNIVHAQITTVDFHYLDKMEGTWTMTTKRSTYLEKWSRMDENTWQGQSWRIVGKDSTKMDDMRLIRTPTGIYYAIAAVKDPKTGKAMRFPLRVLKPVGFVAENLESDYPQKVIYRWKSEKRMDAHFEGKKEKTFSEIIMQYVKE